LVSAVELFPIAAGLDRNVRWKKIAQHVGNGRSKKECFEAFRDHCVNAKEKKKKKESRRSSIEPPTDVEEGLDQQGYQQQPSQPVTLPVKLRDNRKDNVRRSEQFPPPSHQSAAQEVTMVVESFDDKT
jgi:hypothetical protein